jgi:hypothetical protein
MKVEIVYIFPLNGAHQFIDLAVRFVESYHNYPPKLEHETTIVCNGSKVTEEAKFLFASLPNAKFFEHDNTGFDIGAFQAVANQSDSDMVVWFGSDAYFHKAGWLARMVEAWLVAGQGLYANSSSDSPLPHVRTTGFVCSPNVIRSYPKKVISLKDRYDFEHGPDSITMQCVRLHIPVHLITWDGIWDMSHWQNPENIYGKGDRTNCLIWDRHII